MAKHHRKHKEGGGEANFGAPRDDWKKEEDDKPPVYAGREGKVPSEAEEKKHGGKAKRHKRAHGGKAAIHKHHEKGEHMKHAKHLGHVHGEMAVHKGRAPRKAGGRTGSNFAPLSSAHAGSSPRDHKTTDID